ncbi:MAG: hypothetical protein Kow0047_19460 [Anaerolineae bacterium]
MNVQEAIDAIIAAVPGAPLEDTVDTVKIGDPSQELRGVAVTFLGTCQVIDLAAQVGANLLITHEPIFYNHRDEVERLADDPIYRAKRELIERHGLVIWRFHDYLHRLPPDATIMGLREELGWGAPAEPDTTYLCPISPMTLRQLTRVIQERLAPCQPRIVGAPDMICRTVALLPGAAGMGMHLEALRRSDVDVLVVGEVHEWETSEYVRDAVYLGVNKALIVLGHAISEEPGMRWIVPWLRSRIPGVPVTFIAAGSPFCEPSTLL